MSSNFTFKAHTKRPNTDWFIDIYDHLGDYVNGEAGHTYNGQIAWTWDLTDTYGNPRDDLETDPFFDCYITFSTTAGVLTTRGQPAPQTAYPPVGHWLISYCDRYHLDGGARCAPYDGYYSNGINTIAGGPALRSIPYWIFPIKFGTNIYSQGQRNESWGALKAALFDPRYRNFYYYGHGNTNIIGCDSHKFDTNGYITEGVALFSSGSKAFLTSQCVSNELTFNRYSGARPYRFVWLDCCNTANGDWPGAFGVDKAIYDIDHYTNTVTNPKHTRPSAFVGWNQLVGGAGWGTVDAAWRFRGAWMFDWSYWWQSRGVRSAFENARTTASWPPGGYNQLWGALRLFGYTNMQFNAYNQKNDWRWP